jgi:hypothetical protein
MVKVALGYAILWCMEKPKRGKTMPQVRKLAPEEVQDIQNKGKGLRTLVAEQYDAILSDYAVGEYGEATLESDENRLTVRNRMKAAAGRRNVGIAFRRTSGDILRFQIVEQNNGNGAAKAKPMQRIPEPEPVAPPKRKGGRPKKTT